MSAVNYGVLPIRLNASLQDSSILWQLISFHHWGLHSVTAKKCHFDTYCIAVMYTIMQFHSFGSRQSSSINNFKLTLYYFFLSFLLNKTNRFNVWYADKNKTKILSFFCCGFWMFVIDSHSNLGVLDQHGKTLE